MTDGEIALRNSETKSCFDETVSRACVLNVQYHTQNEPFPGKDNWASRRISHVAEGITNQS